MLRVSQNFKLDSSNRLLVFGQKSIGKTTAGRSDSEPFLRRYTADGKIDPTFHGGTDFTIEPGGSVGEGQDRDVKFRDVGVDAQGNILFTAVNSLCEVENENSTLISEKSSMRRAAAVAEENFRQLFSFSTRIRDTDGVDALTLGKDNLKLFDADGNSRKISFLYAIKIGDSDYQATYRITGPTNGTWTKSDNGAYEVRLQKKQIADTDGNHAAAQVLGKLRVKIA